MSSLITSAVQSPSNDTLPTFLDAQGTERGQMCVAWASITASGTIVANSFNVSSVVVAGVGDITVYFTNPLQGTPCVIATAGQSNVGNTWACSVGVSRSDQVRVFTFPSQSGVIATAPQVYVAVFADLPG